MFSNTIQKIKILKSKEILEAFSTESFATYSRPNKKHYQYHLLVYKYRVFKGGLKLLDKEKVVSISVALLSIKPILVDSFPCLYTWATPSC